MENEILKRYEKWGFPQNKNPEIQETLRVNSHLISSKKLQIRLEEKGIKLKKVPFLSNGFYYKSEYSLVSSIEYLLGYFYIQEAPSQIIGEIIKNILKNSDYSKNVILDMCSAPGGKATHIGDILRNKGKIIALEENTKRFNALCYNIERMRLNNIFALNTDALDFKSTEIFDIILVDAPCSGNYLHSKDWINKRKIKDFKNRQILEKKLIDKADSILQKGKHLIYSTCSLEPEENEEIVEYILKKGYTLEKIKIEGFSKGMTKETKNAIRIFPVPHNQPGFFIASLTKI